MCENVLVTLLKPESNTSKNKKQKKTSLINRILKIVLFQDEIFDKGISEGKTDSNSAVSGKQVDTMSGFTALPRGARCVCRELSRGPGDINLL